MALSAGEKLGPYEILSLLGKGGMGEVYKAHDSRLNRDVAIKVSHAEFSERFEREATAVAALNHSSICTLYDVGPNYLVMEHIEGTPLKGPLPLDQALKYAVQICDALAAAHKKGITHRDLKPTNILVTKAGVKLLDFGLAKFAPVAPAAGAPDGATLTMALTGKHQILGTLYYMSPEQLQAQANGQGIDGRSDIFSFGLVLYEMLTGKRAFEGSSPASVIAAIMERPAPSIGTIAPPALDWVLQTCLAKDPDERWQTARDLRRELERVANASSEAAAVPATVSRRRALPWIAVAAASTLALIVAAVGWYNATRPAPPRALIRLNAEIAPDTPLAGVDVGGVGSNMLALSPDGVRLALTLRGADGKARLHTRRLDQSQVTPLVGTENAYSPFFSPAGDWIGFFAEGKLKKIAVEGGAAVTLCDARSGYGGSWGDDRNIIAALNATGGLSRVPSAGGTPVPVTKLNPGEATHRWPQVLPGSQTVLFTVAAQIAAGYDDANLEVISLQTGERKTIQRGGFSARYVSDATGPNGTGHLLYLQQSTLFAVPFDPARLTSTGSPTPILEDVSSTQAGGGDFAFAQNGTFVYLSGNASLAAWSISWLDSSGKTQPLHAPPGVYLTPRFSPDGKRLAFSMRSGTGSDIWVKDLDRDTPSRLSFLPGLNDRPVWTPDAKNIVFRSTNPAAPGLYGIRSDGSGEAKRLTEDQSQRANSFSPDGKRLAVSQTGNDAGLDIVTMPVEADPGPSTFEVRLGKAELFLGTPFNENSPAFSPDGRWLAYVSNESGMVEVYVRPFPRPGGRWQVSMGGGVHPVWSRDGRELLFRTLDRRVMAVSYTAKADSFAPAKPRVWTETRLRSSPTPNYDLAPDGKRLAAIVADDAEVEKLPTHLTFLLNFSDELRRKAPGGR